MGRLINRGRGQADFAASERQSRLLSLLACPGCGGPVSLSGASARGGYVFDADISCAGCGLVGVVTDGIPSFLPHDISSPETPRGLVSATLERRLGDASRRGDWNDLDRGLHGLGIGAEVRDIADCRGIVIEADAHQWSGRVEVRCGPRVETIDLYSDRPHRAMIAAIAGDYARHSWAVRVVDGRNPASADDQIVLRDVRRLVPTDLAPVPDVEPVNRGNPYPDRLAELLQQLPADAVVFDLGGGDRRHDDQRVLNMEYLPYRAVDMRGDGLRLPIRSDSVDLILSQAVLEHVPDPQLAVNEMRRVLKPGGVVYAEIAFMQPLHAVPFHFFNVTPHGAALLFQEFGVERSGTFGGLAVTMDWFFRLLDAPSRIGPEATASVLDDLARLDRTLGPDDLAQVASAVYVEARKRAFTAPAVAPST